MKVVSRVLVLALCVTAMAFGAIIDDFSTDQVPGAASLGPLVPDTQGNRRLFADSDVTNLAITSKVLLGEFRGSAESGTTGLSGATYTTWWDLSAPSLALAIELAYKDDNPGFIEFGVYDGVTEYWSPSVALGAPGLIQSAVLSSWASNLGNVQVGFRVTHGDDLDYRLDNFQTVIPEPGTYALMGVGLLAFFAVRRRKA